MSGVDISHYQTVTDWGALSKAVDFVILKATEGTGYRDATYTPRISELRVRRVKVGAYHFASSGDPIPEADAFLAYAKPLPADILALDVEAGILTRLPGAQLVAWCKTWLDHVKTRTGITPHIYMSLAVVNSRDWSPIARTYPLWLAAYRDALPVTKWWTKPAIWQHTSTGRIPGINGNVDLNVTYTVTAPTPAPKPTAAPTPAPTTDTDDLEPNMQVTFTDAYQVAQEMAAGKTEAQARDAAQVTYTSTQAALEGVLSYMSSILRDVQAIKKGSK